MGEGVKLMCPILLKSVDVDKVFYTVYLPFNCREPVSE